jgi:hypothetical protein
LDVNKSPQKTKKVIVSPILQMLDRPVAKQRLSVIVAISSIHGCVLLTIVEWLRNGHFALLQSLDAIPPEPIHDIKDCKIGCCLYLHSCVRNKAMLKKQHASYRELFTL